jgi:centrosomal protein CEP164
MSEAPNPDSVVLEEQIDPNYVPKEEEVIEYALWLGINLDIDKDLIWIAREGLMAPLPPDWKPCKAGEDLYYFNFTSGESTWDHPCDDYYKKLYEEEKKKKEIKLKVDPNFNEFLSQIKQIFLGQ